MRKLLVVLVAALLVACMTTVALAQGIDGTLRGEVKDPKGLALAGAKVTIRSEGTGEERPTTTSSAGTFEIPHLLVGKYTVTVEQAGFKKYVSSGVEVKQNEVAEVSITMEIGEVTTVVEVTSGAEMVQTTTSDLATSWDSRATNEIPLPSVGINPDPQSFAILLPGTTTQSGGVAGYGGSIGGNRPRDNNFVLDGVDNNNIGVTGPDQPVIPDAVGELTIITNQFSAEYGHSTAGQFIMTTKSGTNQFHGDGFWFNNNRAYNSDDQFTKLAILSGQQSGKSRFDLNRSGGTIGGPIVKDHWFIFGGYQYTDLGVASIPSSSVSVPTAAGIAALQTLSTTAGSGVAPYMVKIITDSLPAAPTQNGTAMVENFAAPAATRQVAIPVGDISPAAPSYQAQTDFAIASDVDAGKHRFSTRVLYDRLRLPLTAAVTVPAFTGFEGFDNRSVTFSDVYSITPFVVNEFRTGYRRTVGPNLAGPSLKPPGNLDVYPNFVITELGLNIGPNGCTPQSTTINTYQWSDNLTISHGAHTLKMGPQVMLWISPVNFLARSRGEYDYTGLNDFVHDSFGGDVLLPTLAIRGAGSGGFAGNQKAIYLFFQDDWKATSRLTLNMGLRYEYVNNPRALNTLALNSISNDPNPTQPVQNGSTPSFLAPLIFAPPATDTNNFGPRFGFAYDVFGNHKTSIRGGAAVAYDFFFNNFYTANALAPGLQLMLDIGTTCTFKPAPAYCPIVTNGSGGQQLSGPLVLNGGLPRTGPAGAAPTQAAARAATAAVYGPTVEPKVITWTLGVQHEFGKDWALEVRYVGTRGLELPVQIRPNSRPVAPTSAFLPTFFSAASIPATLPASAPNLANFLTFGALPLYAADGFLNGTMTTFKPEGSSIYHGGSVDLTRRLAGMSRWSHGVLLKTNYTYSKEIDTATNEFFTSYVNPRRAQDGYNLANERGLGAIDHRHKFALATLYELPWYQGSSGFLKGFANGWELSGTYIAETGQPIDLLSFDDANNNGDGSAGDRAIVNPGFTGSPISSTNVNVVCRNSATGATSVATTTGACGSNGNVVGYVAKDPTAHYVTARVGGLANIGRNTITSAGINNWNIEIMKKTHITESKYLEFRVTMVNAFNHAQPTIGGGTIETLNASSSAPGQALVQVTDPNIHFLQQQNVFSSGNGQAPFQRVITFGLKLFF